MLNEPRKLPYDFCVFLFDGIIYLVDKSEITYPCSTRAHYWCEPLYWENGAFNDLGEELPDPCYILESDIDEDEMISLQLDEDDVDPSVDESEAWDLAREEAHSNHLI